MATTSASTPTDTNASPVEKGAVEPNGSLKGASTSPATRPASAETAYLTAVRSGAHQRFDRVVFEFEAVLTWVVGARARVPFRVTTLPSPSRLVVDLEHPR